MTERPRPARPSSRPFGRAGPRIAPTAAAWSGPPRPGPTRSRARIRLRAALGAAAAVLAVLVLGFGAAIWFAYLRDMPQLPPREAIYAANRAPAIRFLDRTGQVIAARGPRYGERVRLADLPEHVPLAFLAAEDRRFYQHGPVDLRAIARAAFVNWRTGEVVQGGSTLSQQLAKGLFLTPEQTLKRKVQEAVLAAPIQPLRRISPSTMRERASAPSMLRVGARREGALGRAASSAASPSVRRLAGLPK